MSGMASLVAEQGFFAGISEHFATTLGEFTTQRKAAIDELLFRQDEPANHFFIVKSGLVAIEVYAPGRDPVVVDQVYEGDAVGWSWLVPPYRCKFDARAVEPSTLIDVDAAALRERFATDPAFGYEVMRRFVPLIARRLSSARERLVECLTEPS
jgi:CRP-like cAMP-binding protein